MTKQSETWIPIARVGTFTDSAGRPQSFTAAHLRSIAAAYDPAKRDAPLVFGHPYHSWERGLNENFNGLLRQYFPKGASLASVTQDEIVAAMCRLNWRPRKCLGFKTPYEAFCEDANTQITGVAL